MKFDTTRPHIIFFCSSLLLLLGGFLFRNTTLDFNFGATYYVVNYFLLALILAIFLSILGAAYLLLRRLQLSLSQRLCMLHTGFTLGGPLVALLLAQGYRDFHEFHFNAMLTSIIHLVLALTFAAQLILLFNVIRALKK